MTIQPPIYKHQVYSGHDREQSALDAAREQGFRYYTWGTQDEWWEVPASGDRIYSEHSRGSYRDLKSDIDSLIALRSKVGEYLAQPERSMRTDVTRSLEGAGFFSALTRQKQLGALSEVLDKGDYCPQGVSKFRDFIGTELLPPAPPKKVIKKLRVQIELDVELDSEVVRESGSMPDFLLADKVNRAVSIAIGAGEIKSTRPTKVKPISSRFVNLDDGRNWQWRD